MSESQENRIIDVSAKDPVCGMAVDPAQSRGKAQHEGQTYFFCSPGCMHKFVSSPAKYLSRGRGVPGSARIEIGAGQNSTKIGSAG